MPKFYSFSTHQLTFYLEMCKSVPVFLLQEKISVPKSIGPVETKDHFFRQHFYPVGAVPNSKFSSQVI